MQPIIEKNIETIKMLCREHHIKSLYAFGSAVSGDFTSQSDIDLLYVPDYSGFDNKNPSDNPYDPFLVYFELKEKLETLLGRPVDLIHDRKFKNKYLNDSISCTKTPLYVNA